MARYVNYHFAFRTSLTLFRLDLFYDARYSHTQMTNPDFSLLAQAMGVHAIRCETLEELPAKMKEFLEYRGDKPVLMECLVETNEHVFPMVWSFFPTAFAGGLTPVLRFRLERPCTSRYCTGR